VKTANTKNVSPTIPAEKRNDLSSEALHHGYDVIDRRGRT
jgi:hypothetical protein